LVVPQAVVVVQLVQVERARVVDQFGDIQGDVGTATSQANQANRGKLLITAVFRFFEMHRWRKHHVAQSVEVVEDAVGVGFREVKVRLCRDRLRTVMPLGH
nr:hypothetical protein [Tanacetum cinerariifolium]